MQSTIREINLVDEPCPHCGQMHEAHEHRNGATSCADGTVVAHDYPYNVVRIDEEGDIL